MPKQRHIQKMIVTAFVADDGNIALNFDYFPNIPEDKEKFKALPEGRQGTIAVIKKLSHLVLNGVEAMINESMKPQEPPKDGKAA